MTARRSSTSLSRRLVWLVLLVGVLVARGLAPEGWMPVANAAGGLEITVCNGSGPADAMVLSADGKLHHKAPAKGQMSDHPCAFAGLGIADASAPPPAIVAPIGPTAAGSALTAITMFPGRGLAAPPPPATGPPALA